MEKVTRGGETYFSHRTSHGRYEIHIDGYGHQVHYMANDGRSSQRIGSDVETLKSAHKIIENHDRKTTRRANSAGERDAGPPHIMSPRGPIQTGKRGGKFTIDKAGKKHYISTKGKK